MSPVQRRANQWASIIANQGASIIANQWASIIAHQWASVLWTGAVRPLCVRVTGMSREYSNMSDIM